MTTAQKLQLANDLETALQNVSPLPIGVFGNLSQFIRTLRSNRTVVLEFKEPGAIEPSRPGKEYLVATYSNGWDVSYGEPNVFDDDARLVAPLPDLGEIETEKGGGE